MQALPWMISPTPARALGTNALAYASAASGPSPAPSSTGARYSRLRTVVAPMRSSERSVADGGSIRAAYKRGPNAGGSLDGQSRLAWSQCWFAPKSQPGVEV